MSQPLSLLLALSLSLALAGAAGAGPPTYYMAIHCEPQHAGVSDWNALVALVAAADARGIKLTLQFNPLWGGVLNADPSRLDAVSNWVDAGHEAGGHHHVISHAGAWDGYSNLPGAPSVPKWPGYQGDMVQWLLDLESALAGAASILTVSSKDEDFPSGVDFQTGGSDSTVAPSDAAAAPRLRFLNGQAVWNLKHSALIAGGTWQIEAMKASFLVTPEDQVFGAAVHPNDYTDEGQAKIDEWLDFLVSQDPDLSHSGTAGAILEAHRTAEASAVPLFSQPVALGMSGLLLSVGCLVLGARRRVPREPTNGVTG